MIDMSTVKGASLVLSAKRTKGHRFSRALPKKISTGLEKLAPAGWHGWHVFATVWISFVYNNEY